MPIEALRNGFRWDYETFPEYLDMVEGIGIVPQPRGSSRATR